MRAPSFALLVRCLGPLGSCSPVCPLGALCCACGVLGHLAPVHRCAARCVVLRVRCPGPLGTSSLVCPVGVLCCVCSVLGHLAPVHRCACSVRCFARAVSSATCLLYTGVPALCVVSRLPCPGLLGSCVPVCALRPSTCLCDVLGHLAPVHQCARLVCCVACAVSWATGVVFTGVPALCVVLRVPCPGPLGSCSPVCPLSVLCCVYGVLGRKLCFARFCSKLLSVSEPPSQKKTAFLHKNGGKKPFCSLKQCFWDLSGQLQGPIPYSQGAGLKKKVICKVFEQMVRVSGPPSPKKAFLAKDGQRKAFFWPETVFLGPEWSQVGPHTLF